MAKPDRFQILNEQLGSIEEFLDVFRPLVAALKNDGFTEREARMIVAGVFGPRNDPENKFLDEDKP
jgi:hypothetical protein